MSEQRTAEKNLVPTMKVTLEIPIGLHCQLHALVGTGLYGRSVEQAAQWIIADEVRRQIIDGKLFSLYRRYL